MFDSIITEADERFDLGGKAGTLLSTLLALMIDSRRDGIAGFLERFNQTTSSDAVSSWINSGENTEVSIEQIESALGKDTLATVSSQIGTDYDKTVSAAAFMIPRIIDSLTPDGIVPPDDDLLSRVGNVLNGVNETSHIDDKYKINKSPLGWILPLILLGLLLTLGYWFCSRTPLSGEATDANTNQANTNAANQ